MKNILLCLIMILWLGSPISAYCQEEGSNPEDRPSYPLEEGSNPEDRPSYPLEEGSNPEGRPSYPLKEGSTVIVKPDEPITLHLKDAEITDVLRLLTEPRQMNLVVSPDVQGKVSVNLYGVSFEQALLSILTLNGYTYMEKGNLLLVGTPQNLGQAKQLSGGKIKSILTLKYANAEDAEKSLQKLISADGKVLADVKSGTIYIEDYEDNIRKAEDLIKNIDIEPRQVMIEAVVLQVSLDEDSSLGIKWDWLDLPVEGASDVVGTISTQGFSSPAGTSSTGFFAAVTNAHIEAFLDTLSTTTDFNLLASPKLLAVNEKQAEIIIGSRLGYKVTTTTTTGTLESVEFLDVGTRLIITPHISRDGKILMEIHPEVSEGSISTTGLPSKQTTETTTNVLVGDGQTIVIGGLMRQRGEEIVSKVPVVGDIPLFGLFFRRKEVRKIKEEIAVLMTPYLINEPVREEKVKEAEKLLEEIKKSKGKYNLP